MSLKSHSPVKNPNWHEVNQLAIYKLWWICPWDHRGQIHSVVWVGDLNPGLSYLNPQLWPLTHAASTMLCEEWKSEKFWLKFLSLPSNNPWLAPTIILILEQNNSDTLIKQILTNLKGWALARLAAHSASLGMVKELAQESSDEAQNPTR